MRKRLLLILLCALMLFTGCKPAPVQSVALLDFLGNAALNDFIAQFESNFPQGVVACYQTVAGATYNTANDAVTIQSVIDALINMQVQGKKGSGHTDDYLTYYFVLADGTTVGNITFQTDMLLSDIMDLYEVTGYGALVNALPPPQP